MNQSKIVFVGDLHLSDRQIVSRVDDTTETCLEKFEWILDYASSIGADIIHTGDMFSHTLFNNRTRYRVKKALKKFKDNGLCFFSVSGNHNGDVEDRNFDSVVYRELGQFCLDEYVNFLGEFEGKFTDYDLGFGVVRGYSAYSELILDNPEKVVGLVCHHWIMDAFGDSLVVYPDDMLNHFPNLRFIVAGHDHAYHEPYYSRDGVWVVRPGSVMRTDSGKSSDRIPSIEVYTPGTGDTNDRWEKVPIACARPYSEVFYSEKKQTDAESVNALDRFVRRMQGSSGTVMDITAAVRDQLSLVPAGDLDMIKTDLISQGFMV